MPVSGTTKLHAVWALNIRWLNNKTELIMKSISGIEPDMDFFNSLQHKSSRSLDFVV